MTSDYEETLLEAAKALVIAERRLARSESMRASIARRKAAGKPIGRGHAPDREPRLRSGYIEAWNEGGLRRAAGVTPHDENGNFTNKS